jgi:hypothetical protein
MSASDWDFFCPKIWGGAKTVLGNISGSDFFGTKISGGANIGQARLWRTVKMVWACLPACLHKFSS